MTYEFSAICETCLYETDRSTDMAYVKGYARFHSLRRPGHVLLYRTHESNEGEANATA